MTSGEENQDQETEPAVPAVAVVVLAIRQGQSKLEPEQQHHGISCVLALDCLLNTSYTKHMHSEDRSGRSKRKSS